MYVFKKIALTWVKWLMMSSHQNKADPVGVWDFACRGLGFVLMGNASEHLHNLSRVFGLLVNL